MVKSLVVYESMYGNTHVVAAKIAEGLSEAGETLVVAVDDVVAASMVGVDLLVVGGPTHVHGMSRASTRASAAQAAKDSEKHLTLDSHAAGSGLREWFETVRDLPPHAAAFDSRTDLAPVLTGRASRGIAKRLKQHGCELVSSPESFLVDTHNRLIDGEAERALRWGAALAQGLRASGMAGTG